MTHFPQDSFSRNKNEKNKDKKKKMSSRNDNSIKVEIPSDILTQIGLPTDVIHNKVIKIEDVVKDPINGDISILLHYNQSMTDITSPKYSYTDEQIESIYRCRGKEINLTTKKLVKWGFPIIKTVSVNNIPSNGLVGINTLTGVKIPTWYRITKRYGGTIIYVSKFSSGEVKFGINKKINAVKSHFANSDNFVDIFFKNQNVFKSGDDLFKDFEDNTIHVFILNDLELLVDSREKQDTNKIIYLRSYNEFDENSGVFFKEKTELTKKMEKIISDSNASNPIIISKELSIDEANEILKGEVINFDYSGLDSLEISERINRANALLMFSGGDCVIYECDYGIFSLSPSSFEYRSRLTGGKSNIKKMFYDNISNYKESKFVTLGFSPDDLIDIHEKIKNNEKYDIMTYPFLLDNPILIILTNLFFIVPVHKIDEVFEVFNNFGKDILRTVKYFIEIKNTLRVAHAAGRIIDVEAMLSVGKRFLQYLSSSLDKVFDQKVKISYFGGPNNTWSNEVTDFYNDQYKIYSTTKEKDEKIKASESMKIIAMICNSGDDILYSFYTYEYKVKKERESKKKSGRLNF